jgi:hypothetical protein
MSNGMHCSDFSVKIAERQNGNDPFAPFPIHTALNPERKLCLLPLQR